MKTKTENKKSRYITVSARGVKGIREDLITKRFLVQKYIRGERYSASFDSINEAADWKKNFHPSLNLKPLTHLKRDKQLEKISKLHLGINRPESIVLKNGNDYELLLDYYGLLGSKRLTLKNCSEKYNCSKDKIHTSLKISKLKLLRYL